MLRPGGMFAAVTQRHVSPDPTVQAVFAALRPLWDRADSAARPPRLGDPRTTDGNALRALASPWFSEVTVQSFDLAQSIERASLPEFLFDALYGVDALPPEKVAGLLGELELPDPVRWTTPMLYLSARV